MQSMELELSSADHSISPICLWLAVSSGCSMTLAAVVVAYPEHRAKQELAKNPKYERTGASKIESIVTNLIFCSMSVGLNIIAVRYGPVAVVTPVSTGANLMSNMLLQPFLGIATYTHNQILGTLILVASVAMLLEVGPSDIEANKPVLDLILASEALIFISASFLAMILSLCAIARDWVSKNLFLVFLYSILGGTVSVINVAITKVVQMPNIPSILQAPMLLVYVILAIMGVANGARANGELDDPSLFIPIGAGVNLLLTCLAGLFIWEDDKRLQNPLCYAMVYVVVVLATVVVSEDDLLGIADLKVKGAHMEKVYEKVGRGVGKDEVYVDADLHPRTPRGRRLRELGEDWKTQLRCSVPADEHGRDQMIELLEAVIEKYSPKTLDSVDFHDFVVGRLSSVVSKSDGIVASTEGTKAEPLLRRGRPANRSGCQCVMC